MQKRQRPACNAAPLSGAAIARAFIKRSFPKIITLSMVMVLLFLRQPGHAQQQALSLEEAVNTGVSNYQSIRAKQHYVQSSSSLVKNARNEYLPNVILSVQHNYGTVNGQFGPLSGVGGLGVASAGPSYSDQSWNAAFGALYLINTNWEVFTFGRVRSNIQLANVQVRRDSADLLQEQFVHRVKIAGSYLTLLIAQRLGNNAQSNLDRAMAVLESVRARTRTGLNAGVDSSLANAEVSRARLALIEARNNEQQIGNQLAQLLNTPPADFVLDTIFFHRIPTEFNSPVLPEENPQVKFYKARIDQSTAAERFLKKGTMPSLSLFGAFQSRASGFDYNYSPEFPDRYSKSYSDGIRPDRSNYVVGLSLAWNLMSPWKVKQRVNAQEFITAAYQSEYDLIVTQLKDQLVLYDQRIGNSLQSVREVPLQYKAASDAYLQKSVLYKNGLTNIVDLQQALYILNRAETDMSVAYINVWQALLLKAAASGDFDLFINQAR